MKYPDADSIKRVIARRCIRGNRTLVSIATFLDLDRKAMARVERGAARFPELTDAETIVRYYRNSVVWRRWILRANLADIALFARAFAKGGAPCA